MKSAAASVMVHLSMASSYIYPIAIKSDGNNAVLFLQSATTTGTDLLPMVLT